MIGGLLDHI